MMDAVQVAGQAAMQGLLNCYIRETGEGKWLTSREDGASEELQLLLPRQQIEVRAAAGYRSPTGRHLFHSFRYRAGDAWVEADYMTLAALLYKELAPEGSASAVHREELMLRTIQSCQNVAAFAQARGVDREELYGEAFDFIQAEQSLVFGHLIHPTPKSRQGIEGEARIDYSPEMKGSFQLHLFRAHASIVQEDSALPQSATELVKEQYRRDPAADPAFVAAYCGQDDWSLLPVHPLQAAWLLEQPHVQAWLAEGVLQNLGPAGSAWQATSSLRTVYHPDADYMIKGSIPVKVTNSLRVNLTKELDRGVEVSRLLQAGLGELKERFPRFRIIGDPAYLTLKRPGYEESGFELVLRDNPFRGNRAQGATLIAGLGQDPLPGSTSRIGVLIRSIAEREGRTTAEVSLDWFRRYMNVSLRPMLWLYMTWGIALEAHQQNSVVQLEEGYPSRFYYRDNQGYYFCRSTAHLLERELPGVGEKSQTVCDDAVADERLRYYLFYNHLFGLINGFGTAGLIDERLLLAELRTALERFKPFDREPSGLLDSLLQEPVLPCKANLLTRLHDMDELAGAMETQSVYVPIDNPLVKEVGLYDDGASVPAGASGDREDDRLPSGVAGA
ncbi:IucA/IucC family siderophore biosynthesis protein [Paenibacillus sambharensis]|uniref:IucA/IucC family siderophore biosynthesis protein n=1 Tax=Paenibacillus sambharensis TaxID=1803190 RepID=A0A2W1L5J8_9BACL|nr:IucA/IucC family protein [Paenibacillus sambharensis]PZD95398.1 IucA/IucC family siderophore biosynthesis protein [Paenibacillus sambharensis]